ncbi:carboxypeptidase-like regulatory domain-containing protein [Halorubrum sp. GN11GM_10-3_MGM]|uniref:carboxypeptidase-like regulatory domain-containing protein n=1 Tax=Halorubrum sp. GN11GM_10-3_MGM TaxID=2518111 RepID=UPI0013050A6A|nr:carboxypeptidase-like regulatory domain-containing protein [Halorubrum sp. GN11GM_10-3_MGM]
MLIIAMVGAPLMAGSAAASQDTTAVITVTDADGNAIDGANVEVFDAVSGNPLGSPAMTGTNGEANVTWTASNSTTIDVEVYHPDYQPLIKSGVLTVSAGDSESYSASMGLTGDIEVSVVDSAGNPIDGANVDSNTGAISEVTGSDGLVTLSDVPAGDYDLTVSASDYSSTSTTVTVSDGSFATPTVALNGATSKGSLALSTSNATITGPSTDVQFTITDSESGEEVYQQVVNGRMNTEVPSGTYTVTASRPDRQATTREVTVTDGEETYQTLDLQTVEKTVTSTVSDGDVVDEVFAEVDLRDYSEGDNVTVSSDITMVIEDDDGNPTEYVDLGSVEEDYEVGGADDYHTVFQNVGGTPDGADKIVASTNSASDVQIVSVGYLAGSGGVGGVGGYSSGEVLIGAGIVILVIGGAAVVIARD